MSAVSDTYNPGSDTYSGGFPLERTLEKFQPTTPMAPLSVITTAADLPKPAPKPPAPASAPQLVVKIVQRAQPAAIVRGDLGNALPNHLLNGSLLGLAAAGGVFFWRTRRP